MLHHGVGIDLADRADLVLILVLAFVFVFALAEQTSGDVAEGAEPSFSFQNGFIFHLLFRFVFKLFFEFGFQFTFHLVCHDESSSLMIRT